MEFEFSGVFYLESGDFEEMVDLCKKGASPEDAYREVSAGWDDCDYFIADYVANDIIKEIEKRLDNSNQM